MANEIQKFFWGKVKFGKLSTESEKCFGNGEKFETEGKCIIASGRMDTPFCLSGQRKWEDAGEVFGVVTRVESRANIKEDQKRDLSSIYRQLIGLY